jgi:hypothetical protein
MLLTIQQLLPRALPPFFKLTVCSGPSPIHRSHECRTYRSSHDFTPVLDSCKYDP